LEQRGPEKLYGTEVLDAANENADDGGPQKNESDPEQDTEPSDAVVADFFEREDHGDGWENREDPPAKRGLQRELVRCVERGAQIGDPCNDGEAEDVMQDAYVRAYEHLDQFAGRAKFSTWLTRIAIYQAFMLLRRRRKALEVTTKGSGDDVKSVSETLVDRSPDPEESCWRRERSELLSTAINHLSPTIRRTVILRDIEERSVKETADILGASIAAVKSRVSRGRQELHANSKSWILNERRTVRMKCKGHSISS